MKRYKLLTVITLCSACLAFPAFGQNINPTVEVSKTYEGKPGDVKKPGVAMQIPDSLMNLKLDFDYSVFENPYKGSYEFKPYQVLMKPQKSDDTGHELYVRLGAGYSLHPDAEVIWTPQVDGPFHVSVHGSHGSYFGKYRNVFAGKSGAAEAYTLMTDKGKWDATLRGENTGTHTGYDMLNRFGVDGGYDWDKAAFSFDVGYYGIGTKDTYLRRGFNAVDAKARLRNTDLDQRVSYDASFALRHFGDNQHFIYSDDPSKVSGNEASFDGLFGYGLSSGSRALLGVDADFASYSSILQTSTGIIALIPQYRIVKGNFRFNLGVRLETIIKGSESEPQPGLVVFDNYRSSSQMIYPAVSMVYNAMPGSLDLFANVTGGGKLNSYSSVIADEHWFNTDFGRGGSQLLDNSIERINVTAGLRGQYASRLHYEISAGYSLVDSGLLDAVSLTNPLMGGVAYRDFGLLHADAALEWKSDDVETGAALRFRGMGEDDYAGAFQMAPIGANFRFIYNWNKRIYGGVTAEFASVRNGSCLSATGTQYDLSIPAYVDLGLYAEYKFSHKLSFWLSGGNLLDMNIQRHPMYTESGISLTAGIAVNM